MTMTTCTCDNCGNVCDESHLIHIADLENLGIRLDPGSVVPAGECRECGALAYPNLTTYTVLLRRPDYVTTDDDDLYFMAQVEANDPVLAVSRARVEACDADDTEYPDAEDYAVVLVIAGKHDDLNPER
jgi:hypothetical protein